MSKLFSTVAALVLFAVLGAPANAQSRPAWTQAGMLRCVVNPSIGFIIAGHQSMECTFTQNAPIPPQAYAGALNMIGLNIGIMMPVSEIALCEGMRAFGSKKPTQVVIWENLMDAQTVLLTANTETVYALSHLDLKTDGPTVVDAPPHMLGFLQDGLQRYAPAS